MKTLPFGGVSFDDRIELTSIQTRPILIIHFYYALVKDLILKL
jgi:hypothetical protein